jgi:hypothetical protein
MKKTLPSDQDINRKKTLFSESVQEALNHPRKTVKVTVRDKLRLINDDLGRFKNSGISYRIICSLLADKLGLHVSEQTLREHCQQELGFDKRTTGTGTSRKSEMQSAPATQQVNGTSAVQVAALVAPTHHQKETSRENEQIAEVTKQSTTEQISHQPPQPLVTRSGSQITTQTEKLFNKLEDY